MTLQKEKSNAILLIAGEGPERARLEEKISVLNLDEKVKEDPPISEEQYYEWMREAINKGMCVTPSEYEKALGLPFHNVW